jgi:hypothetical protein
MSRLARKTLATGRRVCTGFAFHLGDENQKKKLMIVKLVPAVGLEPQEVQLRA